MMIGRSAEVRRHDPRGRRPVTNRHSGDADGSPQRFHGESVPLIVLVVIDAHRCGQRCHYN